MVVQQVRCPQCQQPVEVPVQQVLDVGERPEVRHMVLSGNFNLMQCPHCGYVGPAPVPVVYHDPDHELLLVYVPPELGLSQEQQEQLVGPILRRIMERLPTEQRKAYLLQPQYVLSLRTLQERVLETLGVSREDLRRYEERFSLLRRLLGVSQEAQRQLLEKEQDLVDLLFLEVLHNLRQAAEMAQNTVLLQRLDNLEKLILETTPLGQQIQEAQQHWMHIQEFLEGLPARLTPRELVDRLLHWPHLDKEHVILLVSALPMLLEYGVFAALQEVQETGSVEMRAKARELHQWLREMLDQILNAQKILRSRVEELLLQLSEPLDGRREDQLLKQLAGVMAQVPSAVEEALHAVSQRLANQPEKRQRLEQRLRKLEEYLYSPEERLLRALLASDDEAVWRLLIRKHPEALNSTLLSLLTEFMATISQPEQRQRLERLFQFLSREVMKRQLERARETEPASKAAAAPSSPAPSREAEPQQEPPTRPRVLRPGEEKGGPADASQLIRPT